MKKRKIYLDNLKFEKARAVLFDNFKVDELSRTETVSVYESLGQGKFRIRNCHAVGPEP